MRDHPYNRALEDAEPPPWVIEAARAVACSSPCAKSKRGVAIYSLEDADLVMRNGLDDVAKRSTILAVAHNAPAPPISCTGSASCREHCAKICNHAEDRAIRQAIQVQDLVGYALVHVKVVDGLIVAGGPPSCWQCSRLISDTELQGVWLYEIGDVWRWYGREFFHRATLHNCGISP